MDIRCMVYNHCFMTYQNDKSEDPQYVFEVADYLINFRDMTETVKGKIRAIRKVDDAHIRLRPDNSERITSLTPKKIGGRMVNYDTNSFRWLDQNYIRRHGLRKWTWRAIIEGIITEHLK